MKLFGQFLIEEGLIRKEDFVSAMIVQAESLPSLALAVHELKLYSIEQQLDIFTHQSTYMREYRAACVEMGIWDEAANDHALGRYFLTRIKPLGAILVEQGKLTLDQLSHVLERYVALGESDSNPPPPAPEAQPRLTIVGNKPIPKRKLAHLKGNQTPALEIRLFKIYCDTFNADFFTAMKAFFTASQKADDSIFFDRLRVLRHAASYINALKSDKLLLALQDLRTGATISGNEAAFVDQALNLLWTVREGLERGIPEIVTLASSGLDSRADELCFILNKIGKTA